MNKLSTLEASSFPDIAELPSASHKVFLYIRNRILQLWIESPKQEVTLEAAIAAIEPPYNSEWVDLKDIEVNIFGRPTSRSYVYI